MDAVTPIGFDYAELEPATGAAARGAAERIRLRMQRTVQDIIEIGRELTGIKKQLGHGHFLAWISAEFEMSESLAQKMMSAAREYGAKSVTVTDLSPSILYALAAPSTSNEVREQVERRVQSGEKVTVDDIKALKEQWAEEKRDLKKQIEDAKFKVRDAKSIRNDVQQQLTDLQRELAELRDERDTLRLELEHKTSVAVQSTGTDVSSIDSQIEMLLADWNRTSPKAREEFLRRIAAPLRGAA